MCEKAGENDTGVSWNRKRKANRRKAEEIDEEACRRHRELCPSVGRRLSSLTCSSEITAPGSGLVRRSWVSARSRPKQIFSLSGTTRANGAPFLRNTKVTFW